MYMLLAYIYIYIYRYIIGIGFDNDFFFESLGFSFLSLISLCVCVSLCVYHVCSRELGQIKKKFFEEIKMFSPFSLFFTCFPSLVANNNKKKEISPETGIYSYEELVDVDTLPPSVDRSAREVHYLHAGTDIIIMYYCVSSSQKLLY